MKNVVKIPKRFTSSANGMVLLLFWFSSRQLFSDVYKHVPNVVLGVEYFFGISILMDILLLLGCYTRFSRSLIKWNSQEVKIRIPLIHLLPHPSYWMNELIKNLIKEFHVNNLNWWQFFPCNIILTYILNPLVL